MHVGFTLSFYSYLRAVGSTTAIYSQSPEGLRDVMSLRCRSLFPPEWNDMFKDKLSKSDEEEEEKKTKYWRPEWIDIRLSSNVGKEVDIVKSLRASQ